MKHEIMCSVEHSNKIDLMNKKCPCGWPDEPCIKEHKELRTDTPPEPGAYDDGETWANE